MKMLQLAERCSKGGREEYGLCCGLSLIGLVDSTTPLELENEHEERGFQIVPVVG